jgi:WD40 repeat protein
MKRKYEELLASSKRAKFESVYSVVDSPQTTVSFIFYDPQSCSPSLHQLFKSLRQKITEHFQTWTDKIAFSRATGFQVWDYKKDKLLHSIEGRDDFGDVVSLIELNNGYLATGSDIGKIVIWNKVYEPVRVINAHNRNVYCLTQLADGSLVSGTAPNCLKIWCIDTGTCITELIKADEASVMDIIQLSNGWIANACGNKIYVWDHNKKACIYVLEDAANRGCVNSVVMLYNGTLVTGSASATVTIWNITKETVIMKMNNLGGSVFDLVDVGSSTFASSINNNTIIFWSYSGERIRVINVGSSMCNMYLIKKGTFILEHGSSFELWDYEKEERENKLTLSFEVEAMALLFH